MPRYQCRFSNPEHPGRYVSFAELSSGEQVIARSMLWAFNGRLGENYKLLLLDEPDAHLHPSMSRLLIGALNEYIVNRMGIQVIMTTHHPSTVALAPEEALYVMHKEGGRAHITKANKQEALKPLTEDLLLVTDKFRIVFVEGKDDAPFYQDVYMELKKLLPDVPLVFKPPSSPGGKEVVLDAVKKCNYLLAEYGFGDFIFGLIDGDRGNEARANISVLPRYCMENYLCDPLVVFAYLLSEEKNKWAMGIAKQCNLSRFALHELPSQHHDTLQGIATQTARRITGEIPDLACEKTREVAYIGGFRVHHPEPFFSVSGKDILKWYRRAFPGDGGYGNDTLFRAMCTAKLIPEDLVDILNNLCTDRISTHT
jgi:energy-coupling factor transporter ATP-binding protein EcfA2